MEVTTAAHSPRMRIVLATYRRLHPPKVSPKEIVRHCISLAEYAALWYEQKGLCAGCGLWLVRPVIDHDHACCPGRWSCGRCIRGLVCPSCNRLDALAPALDSPAMLAGSSATQGSQRSRVAVAGSRPLRRNPEHLQPSWPSQGLSGAAGGHLQRGEDQP